MIGDDDKIPATRIRLLSEIIEREVKKSSDVINARIEGIERGIALFQADLVRVPTALDRAICGLRELIESRLERNSAVSVERFLRVESQFNERDKRSDQLAMASATAITAALQAQKEAAGEAQKSSSVAIAKAEAATSESINQLKVLFQTSISALNTQILDVKSRLDKGEGGAVGTIAAVADHRYTRKDEREESRENRGLVFGIVGVAIGLAALIITIGVSIIPHLAH